MVGKIIDKKLILICLIFLGLSCCRIQASSIRPLDDVYDVIDEQQPDDDAPHKDVRRHIKFMGSYAGKEEEAPGQKNLKGRSVDPGQDTPYYDVAPLHHRGGPGHGKSVVGAESASDEISNLENVGPAESYREGGGVHQQLHLHDRALDTKDSSSQASQSNNEGGVPKEIVPMVEASSKTAPSQVAPATGIKTRAVAVTSGHGKSAGKASTQVAHFDSEGITLFQADGKDLTIVGSAGGETGEKDKPQQSQNIPISGSPASVGTEHFPAIKDTEPSKDSSKAPASFQDAVHPGTRDHQGPRRRHGLMNGNSNAPGEMKQDTEEADVNVPDADKTQDPEAPAAADEMIVGNAPAVTVAKERHERIAPDLIDGKFSFVSDERFDPEPMPTLRFGKWKRSVRQKTGVENYLENKREHSAAAQQSETRNLRQVETSSVMKLKFPSTFCELDRDSGVICPNLKRGLYLEQFYYDPPTNRCYHFIYNGCGGNANRFSSLWECSLSCAKPSEKKVSDD